MQEYPTVCDVKHLVFARGVLALNCSRLDLIELDGAFRQVNTGDPGPESAEDDSLDEVCVVAIGIKGWRGRRGGQRDKANIGEGGNELSP